MARESKRAVDRKRKLHRLLSILRKLDSRERCTPQSLSLQFGTTPRNIYRDMNDLDSAGFAVVFDREADTYMFADPDFRLRDMDLSKEELIALLVGRQISHSLGKPFESAYQSLLRKARTDTGPQTRERIKRIEDTEKFRVDLDPLVGFENIESQYDLLTKAMELKIEVAIEYKGMHEQKETKRIIAPYGMFLSNAMWYVIAYCNLRKGIRQFALDRIKGAKLLRSHYLIPDGFNPDDYLKRYGEPVEVALRFTKDAARWIKRRKWYPTQIIEEKKDGSIIFKATVAGTKEIKWWAYKWTPNCEILAPVELREEAAKEINKLARLYGKKAGKIRK